MYYKQVNIRINVSYKKKSFCYPKRKTLNINFLSCEEILHLYYLNIKGLY